MFLMTFVPPGILADSETLILRAPVDSIFETHKITMILSTTTSW
jgi:hypothetical protein